MKTVKVSKINENVKTGQRCDNLEPNLTESALLEENGEIVGFYLQGDDVPKDVKMFATLMNNELMSDRVPKSMMSRVYYENGKEKRVQQFSAIIGAVKPEPFKRRYKPGLSHVHMEKSADKYIKITYAFAKACEKMIKNLTPELYEKQKKLLKDQKLKIGDLWTSSIANFNGACNTHLDGANIKGANNIIYFKRNNSKGGNLHAPQYGIVVDSKHDSLLFYPAYKHIHGVDNIIPEKDGGYRNSLVLYPLDIKWKE